MKVVELLVFLAQVKGMARTLATREAVRWLDRLGLADWGEKKKVDDLSKGMQQKVQFIATLLHDPELVILDEPYAGGFGFNDRRVSGLFRYRVSLLCSDICGGGCHVEHGGGSTTSTGAGNDALRDSGCCLSYGNDDRTGRKSLHHVNDGAAQFADSNARALGGFGRVDIRVVEFSAAPAACACDRNVDCRAHLSNRHTHARKAAQPKGIVAVDPECMRVK